MLSNNRTGLVVVAVVPWLKIIRSSSLLHSPSPRCASTCSLSTHAVSFNPVRTIVRIDVSYRGGHSFSLPPSFSSSSSLASFRKPREGQQQRKQNNRIRYLAKSWLANSEPRIITKLKGSRSYYASSAALSSALCQSSDILRRPGLGQQQQQRNRRNRRIQQQSSLCVEAIASTDDPTTNLNDRKPLHEELHRYGVHESDYTSQHKVEPQEPDSSLEMNKHKTTSSRMPRKRKATPDVASSSKQQQHPPSKGKSGLAQDWLRQHNGEIAGGAKSARAGRPWRLVCTVRGFNSRSEACQFEWRWKSTAAKIKTIGQQDPETIESTLITRRRVTLAKALQSKEEWSFLNVQWHAD